MGHWRRRAGRCNDGGAGMLQSLGARLTRLTPNQAEYIGVPLNGPFKGDDYRY